MRKWIIIAEWESMEPVTIKKNHVHKGKLQWILYCEDENEAMNIMIKRTRNYVPPTAKWSVKECKDTKFV